MTPTRPRESRLLNSYLCGKRSIFGGARVPLLRSLSKQCLEQLDEFRIRTLEPVQESIGAMSL